MHIWKVLLLLKNIILPLPFSLLYIESAIPSQQGKFILAGEKTMA